MLSCFTLIIESLPRARVGSRVGSQYVVDKTCLPRRPFLRKNNTPTFIVELSTGWHATKQLFAIVRRVNETFLTIVRSRVKFDQYSTILLQLIAPLELQTLGMFDTAVHCHAAVL